MLGLIESHHNDRYKNSYLRTGFHVAVVEKANKHDENDFMDFNTGFEYFLLFGESVKYAPYGQCCWRTMVKDNLIPKVEHNGVEYYQFLEALKIFNQPLTLDTKWVIAKSSNSVF